MAKDKSKSADDTSPLDKTVIPVAFSMVEDPQKPGAFFAVRLENVVAERVIHLEPSKRSSAIIFQLGRMYSDIDNTNRRRSWGGKK